MKFETLAVRGFIDLQKQNHAVSTPIYANTAYSFDSVQHAVDLFYLKVPELCGQALLISVFDLVFELLVAFILRY